MTNAMNTNLQSILSQARSTCSNMFASSNSGSGVSAQYVNSVFDLINEGQAAINGGDEQKAQAITSMVQNIMSMLTNFSNERAKATQDGDKNEKKADDVDKKAQQTASDTVSKADSIVSNIQTEETTIQSTLDKLKELSGDDGEGGKLAEKKEELKKILDEIDAQKNIINDAVSNKEAKQAALKKIQELSGQITGLTAEITGIQASIDELSSSMKASSDKVGEFVEEAATVVEGGAQKLQGYMQNAGQQVATNTAEGVKGTAEEAAGTQIVSAATTASFIPGTQAVTSKAIQVGQDLIAAGGIRIKDSVATNGRLTAALGLMASKAGEFKGALDNVIGSALQANNLVGQYGIVLDSAITSIGSWSTVTEAQVNLDNAIKTADAKLNGTDTKEPKTLVDSLKQNEQSQNLSGTIPPWQQNTAGKSQQQQQMPSQDNNLIFNYDRKTFGI